MGCDVLGSVVTPPSPVWGHAGGRVGLVGMPSIGGGVPVWGQGPSQVLFPVACTQVCVCVLRQLCVDGVAGAPPTTAPLPCPPVCMVAARWRGAHGAGCPSQAQWDGGGNRTRAGNPGQSCGAAGKQGV